MSTLFERIAGGEGIAKLPIHIFTSILEEFKDGRLSAQQAKAILGIDDDQTADVQWIIALLQSAVNKAEVMRLMKNHFYLVEWHATKPHFNDEAAFYQKMQDVVTAQGGTPPART